MSIPEGPQLAKAKTTRETTQPMPQLRAISQQLSLQALVAIDLFWIAFAEQNMQDRAKRPDYRPLHRPQ